MTKQATLETLLSDNQAIYQWSLAHKEDEMARLAIRRAAIIRLHLERLAR